MWRLKMNSKEYKSFLSTINSLCRIISQKVRQGVKCKKCKKELKAIHALHALRPKRKIK